MNDKVYNPYEKLGDIWVPQAVIQAQTQERMAGMIQQELSRQQKRQQRRQELKKAGKWVPGIHI